MARRHLLVPFAALVAACTPRALTPNARGFAFDAPTTPEVGHSDAQFDITRIGMPFGAEAVNGGARYRRTLRPGLVAEGEGGLLHLTNEGSGGSRNAVTGRVGLMLRPPSEQELRTALTLGVGGGLSSTAGDWVSVDVGAGGRRQPPLAAAVRRRRCLLQRRGRQQAVHRGRQRWCSATVRSELGAILDEATLDAAETSE
jgi:hypothetical protein